MEMPEPRTIPTKNVSGQANGANLGFENELWRAADALRSNMDAAEYKHVVLGLIFLKYISDAFEEQHARLEAERDAGADRGPLVEPPQPGQGPEDRQGRRRRHARHRARQPDAQGRASQGLHPPPA